MNRKIIVISGLKRPPGQECQFLPGKFWRLCLNMVRDVIRKVSRLEKVEINFVQLANSG